MGEYLYTLRAKTVKFTMGGSVVSANLFSYLTKPFYSGWLSSRIDRRTILGTARAEAYWAKRELPMYAVNADAEYINAAPMAEKVDQMFPLYTNIKSCLWYDNGNFPGELIGYVHVHSGKVHGVYTIEQHKQEYAERNARREAAMAVANPV